jgi:hypothetical protein
MDEADSKWIERNLMDAKAGESTERWPSRRPESLPTRDGSVPPGKAVPSLTQIGTSYRTRNGGHPFFRFPAACPCFLRNSSNDRSGIRPFSRNSKIMAARDS